MSPLKKLILTWFLAFHLTFAASVPDDPSYNPAHDKQTFLDQLCNSNPILPNPGQDLGGVQYITSGHHEDTLKLPDPSTYKYDVYPLERKVEKAYAKYLVKAFSDRIPPDEGHDEVPASGKDLTLPYDFVVLRLTPVGDKNIVYQNVVECLKEFGKYYEKITDLELPFLQCAIHDDHYLEGKVEMIEKQPSAAECPKKRLEGDRIFVA